MALQVSEFCRDFIASWEGYSEKAYLCPAGVLTIGYGHTQGVRPGDRISPDHAKNLLASDLVTFGMQVGGNIGNAHTDQQEFDAMVSLAFNIGVGGFAGSTVLRLHKKGDKAGAARAFRMWNKAKIDGVLQPVLGLTRRRAAEEGLYLTPDEVAVSLPKPSLQVAADEMPQKVEPPKKAISSKTVLTTAGGAILTTGGVATNAPAALDAIEKASATISQAHSAWSGIEAAIGPLLQSRALPFILGALALGAIVYVLWRYGRKLWTGEAVSS